MLHALRDWAKAVKRDALALYLALRAPSTPWLVKVWAGLIVAYAFSPIDLIPDFIPLLGLLDDLILLPAGIWIAVRLIPADLMASFRAQAELLSERPVSKTAGTVIVMIWIAAALLAGWLVWRYFAGTD